MEAKVIGITTTDPEQIRKITLKDLELDGGHSANICYTERDWEEIVQEDLSKTENRITSNKENNHHSVFGHSTISLYITGIPKLVAMLINNEHEYNTSEKSARYTMMKPTEEEMRIYTKWIKILEQEIKKKYPNTPYLDDKRIHKLAQENARYFLSVLTPTKMRYTTSLRQLNYIYGFCLNLLEEKSNNKLIEAVKPSIEEFASQLEKTGFIMDNFVEYRHRKFSLITDFNDYPEYFGRCYSTNYQATFPEVAQGQRHRTDDYSIVYPEIETFFITPTIEENERLTAEWLRDMNYIRSLNLIPQGTLVNVNETGKYEDFILKIQERLCTCAQLEICNISKVTLEKYIQTLKSMKDDRLKTVLTDLEKFNKGARCLSGYHCTNPCRFPEGVQLTRKI